jgi:hypothetical protein
MVTENDNTKKAERLKTPCDEHDQLPAQTGICTKYIFFKTA